MLEVNSLLVEAMVLEQRRTLESLPLEEQNGVPKRPLWVVLAALVMAFLY